MKYTCPCCGSDLEKEFAWNLDFQSGILFIDKISILLTPRETDILFVLREAKGKYKSKDEICYLISPRVNLGAGLVPVLISKMKKKIKGTNLDIITRAGFGYRVTYKGEPREEIIV